MSGGDGDNSEQDLFARIWSELGASGCNNVPTAFRAHPVSSDSEDEEDNIPAGYFAVPDTPEYNPVDPSGYHSPPTTTTEKPFHAAKTPRNNDSVATIRSRKRKRADQIGIAQFDWLDCRDCGARRRLIESESQIVCQGCGVCQQVMHGDLYTREVTMRRQTTYRPKFYLHERVQQFNTMETRIPWYDWIKIHTAIIAMIPFLKLVGMTKSDIQRVLRSLGREYTKLYLEKWMQIKQRCSGMYLPDTVSSDFFDPIFLRIEQTYKDGTCRDLRRSTKIDPKTGQRYVRKHMPSYNYSLLRLVEFKNRASFGRYFPQLRSDPKRQWHDKLWFVICRENNWPYITSYPCTVYELLDALYATTWIPANYDFTTHEHVEAEKKKRRCSSSANYIIRYSPPSSSSSSSSYSSSSSSSSTGSRNATPDRLFWV